MGYTDGDDDGKSGEYDSADVIPSVSVSWFANPFFHWAKKYFMADHKLNCKRSQERHRKHHFYATKKKVKLYREQEKRPWNGMYSGEKLSLKSL